MSEYVNYDGLKRYDELIKNVISVKTWIGSCSTAAGTAAKVISVESGFKLLKGVRIGVKFTASNTASNVTLNVNSTGAKSIYYNNAVYTGNSNMICGYANRYVFYVYDGTNWVWDGYGNHDNTSYSAMSSEELTTGTATNSRVVRSDYLKAGIKSIVEGYGYTTNTGTVTGVKVGTTSYSPSSGIVTIPAYPTTLPASDVSSWAKAASKPSYSYSEISDTPIIPALIGDDAARACWGGDWRMPTADEFQTLGAAVDVAWTQVNNVYGILCTDKTDSSKTLFFPAAGGYDNGDATGVGNYCFYWSSSIDTNALNSAYFIRLGSSVTNWNMSGGRRLGITIRPILDGANANGHDYVEIGGLKWATINIGASQQSDYGLYFAWGDTQGYTASQSGSGSGKKYFGWADYKYGNGTSSPGATGMTKYNSTDGLTTLECLRKVAITGNYNDLSNKPTSLPASDVSTWAKASSKPSYAYSEIGYSVNAVSSSGGTVSLAGTTPLHLVTLTGNVSALTLSSNPAAGHSCHVIFTAAAKQTVAIAHDATSRVCPGAEDISIEIPAGGYAEIDFLAAGDKVYVRGV